MFVRVHQAVVSICTHAQRVPAHMSFHVSMRTSMDVFKPTFVHTSILVLGHVSMHTIARASVLVYGLYSYGLYSYGLYGYGLYSYGLYSYGLQVSMLACGHVHLQVPVCMSEHKMIPYACTPVHTQYTPVT